MFSTTFFAPVLFMNSKINFYGVSIAFTIQKTENTMSFNLNYKIRIHYCTTKNLSSIISKQLHILLHTPFAC